MDPIEQELLRLFRQVCAEGDLEVAEFLFQALEALDARAGKGALVDAACMELLARPQRTVH